MKIHIPTEQYGFIEMEVDNLVEAKILSDEVKKTWAGEQIAGLDKSNWSRVRRTLFMESRYDPEDLDKMSPLQKWFVHQVENTLQQIKNKQ